MSYRKTCPQRAVTTVHHTIKTWLPVTLSCGHTEQINFTVSEGFVMGCTQCRHDEDRTPGMTLPKGAWAARNGQPRSA
jgi:hypothetical protein